MRKAVVNGVVRELPDDGRSLAHWLRDDIGLTGTKTPCGSGHCGGCTVLLADRPALSCCVLATTQEDARITTIEGLSAQDDVLLRTFTEHGAVQCGFCTPGMIVAARAYLGSLRGQPASAEDVRTALSGNVCRCSGYTAIVDAVLAAAAEEQQCVT